MQDKKNYTKTVLPTGIYKSILTVWVCSLLIIIYTSLQPLPEFTYQTRYMDKLLHALSYLWLAMLLFICLKTNKINLLVIISLILMGVALEIIQSYIPGRLFSIYDMIANTLGVLAGAFLGRKIKNLLASASSYTY